MKLTVNYIDGRTFQADLTPGDFVRFERHFGIAASAVAESGLLEHVYYLAWLAASRSKNTDLDFDSWLDTIALANTEAAGPLQPPSA